MKARSCSYLAFSKSEAHGPRPGRLKSTDNKKLRITLTRHSQDEALLVSDKVGW
jgi:hypothetical protein